MSGILYCYDDNYFSIKNMTIQNGNTDFGGGIYLQNSSPSLENVIISINTANVGGGIYCWDSSPSLTNVTISGNTAYRGGGIYFNNSFPNLTNVTISINNATDYGGGIYCFDCSSLALLNCILWNDSPQEVYFHSAFSLNTVTISYSDIQGGEAGIVTNSNGIVNWLEGNIDADPLFADPQNGDFHLTWANFPIPDSTMSPCIDTGDPNSPFDPDGTIADMGAYYYVQGTGTENYELHPAIAGSKLSNYPNPFNPSTTISFNISRKDAKNAEIIIYNIKGQKIKQYSILNIQSSIVWDGTDNNNHPVSSGIYFYRLKVNNKIVATKKCLLLK
ncbi:MAG: T9SS type A sorting domain-containing protein [Armatimonadetes bacterium]|nr:T9SS type A sorting domain-containing protein [Armatimonadota bacterium]